MYNKKYQCGVLFVLMVIIHDMLVFLGISDACVGNKPTVKWLKLTKDVNRKKKKTDSAWNHRVIPSHRGEGLSLNQSDKHKDPQPRFSTAKCLSLLTFCWSETEVDSIQQVRMVWGADSLNTWLIQGNCNN